MDPKALNRNHVPIFGNSDNSDATCHGFRFRDQAHKSPEVLASGSFQKKKRLKTRNSRYRTGSFSGNSELVLGSGTCQKRVY